MPRGCIAHRSSTSSVQNPLNLEIYDILWISIVGRTPQPGTAKASKWWST